MMKTPKIAGITGRLEVVILWFSEDVFNIMNAFFFGAESETEI